MHACVMHRYVHLLSIIVDVAMCVNAISVGVHTGRQLGTMLPDHAVSAALLCVIALLRVVIFTLVYNGLLSLGICAPARRFECAAPAASVVGGRTVLPAPRVWTGLDNPFDSCPTVSSGADLPGLAFQHSMRNECLAFAKAIDQVHDKEWFTRSFEVEKKEA